MSTPTRRSFLQGVFGGVTAGGLLINTSEKVEAFTVGSPVTLAEPLYGGYVRPGDTLYNASGQMVAIVQTVGFNRNKIEVTTHNSNNQEYMMGVLTSDIRATGIFSSDKPVLCSFCKSPRMFNLPCAQCGAGRL